MANELLSVTVTLLDRPYKLSIEPSKEAALRRAAELTNQCAALYEQHVHYQDRQDLLAMVCLDKITELILTQERFTFKDKELIDRLQDIDTALEQHLHPAQNSL